MVSRLEPGLWRLRQNTGPKAYGNISWRGRKKKAHRAAWEEANGPIPSGKKVCHHCDVRLCINALHLFLGTSKNNSEDMVAKDRHARGERSANAKLTDEKIRAIRADTRPQVVIAKEHDIGRPNVSMIKAGLIWKHVA
jgi:hypothetical protein